MNQGEELGQYETLGSGLRSCDSQSTKLLVTTHGHVGREFKLRPFSAGSILTLRNRIEPLASTTSVTERHGRCKQKTHAVDNCAGKTGFNHRGRRGRHKMKLSRT